jgi:serine/threonine protein kinase
MIEVGEHPVCARRHNPTRFRGKVGAALNALKEGTLLGGYVLLAPLPATDESEVWLARSDDAAAAGSPVVLRTVPQAVAADEALMQAALEESRSALLFEHPHLVRLVDLFSTSGRWIVVSEFVSGRTVRQIMNRASTINRVPPIWFSLHVAAVVCQVLAYLHGRCGELGTHLGNVRHTVSPDSILVSFAGDPQLMAFGIARANALPTISNTSPIPSSFAYAAPERLSDVDTPVADVARSDVYSLGVVLYEMLTARRPFAAEDDESLLREVLDTRREPPPPSMVAPWVTQPLEDIVLTAMARDPRDRFRHAGELGEAIRQYMAWAGVNPSRKHLAQQVCGVVAHADSAPPPSARSDPSSTPPVVPRGARVPSDPDGRAAAAVRGAGAAPPRGHVWDKVTAMARQQREAELRRAEVAPEPASPTTGTHTWDRVVASPPEPDPNKTACQQALQYFEEGIDLARSRDYRAALVKLEQAARLDPDNRVYGANLRRVRKQLENGD